MVRGNYMQNFKSLHQMVSDKNLMESVTFNCNIVNNTNALNSETIRARALKFKLEVESIKGETTCKISSPYIKWFRIKP